MSFDQMLLQEILRWEFLLTLGARVQGHARFRIEHRLQFCVDFVLVFDQPCFGSEGIITGRTLEQSDLGMFFLHVLQQPVARGEIGATVLAHKWTDTHVDHHDMDPQKCYCLQIFVARCADTVLQRRITAVILPDVFHQLFLRIELRHAPLAYLNFLRQVLQPLWLVLVVDSRMQIVILLLDEHSRARAAPEALHREAVGIPVMEEFEMLSQSLLGTVHLITLGALARMVQAVEVSVSITHRCRRETSLAVDTLEALPLRRVLRFGVLPDELQMAECFRTEFALVGFVVQPDECVVFRFAFTVRIIEGAVAVSGRVHRRASIGQIQRTASREIHGHGSVQSGNVWFDVQLCGQSELVGWIE